MTAKGHVGLWTVYRKECVVKRREVKGIVRKTHLGDKFGSLLSAVWGRSICIYSRK